MALQTCPTGHQFFFFTTTVTRRSRFEDKQLHRCMCYLHHFRDKVLTGWIAHRCEDEALLDVYTDSDFAACPHSSNSSIVAFSLSFVLQRQYFRCIGRVESSPVQHLSVYKLC